MVISTVPVFETVCPQICWLLFLRLLIVGAGSYSGSMSSELFTEAGHPVTAALGGLSDTLDATVDAEVWALSDDDLADGLVRLEALAARQAELGLRLVREADARDLARRLGAPCHGRVAAGPAAAAPGRGADAGGAGQPVRPATGRGADRLGRHPSGGPPGSWSMPATAAALAEGAVSAEHAKVVANTMAAMPTSLDSEQVQTAEA